MSVITGILVVLAVIAALALTIGEVISDWVEDKFYDWRNRK